MRSRIRSPALLLLAALVLVGALGAVVAFAENIDPFNSGEQYAWGENVGWLNAEPGSNGGPGVTVSNTALTGYLWGENIGWVNMSCQNTANCAGPAGNWRVTNDGAGNLGGYAWGENVGWLSFSCANSGTCITGVDYGVHINPGTGVFSGYAWGENIGWISFSDDAPVAYRVKTSWPGGAAVGGIADLPEVAAAGAQPLDAPPEGSGSSAGTYAALAAGVAAGVVVLASGVWYARRRRLKA
jgi:hypothetical protein